MFVIDYLKIAQANRIVVPPFHGHLGLMPDSDYYISLLQASASAGGCELCITPYEQPLKFLFSLRCVLKEQTGVVNRLLRAIAAMNINILSWESATLESNGGHGVFMLLDWSTTLWPEKDPLSRNLQELFFPRLSGIVPSSDLRYIRLLRQIFGQCADVLLWEDHTSDGMARPRLRLSEFDEGRIVAAERPVTIKPAVSTGVRLESASVSFSIPSDVASKTRNFTGRDEDAPLHYILVSDSESKTLRAFIPRRGHERRMVHLGFVHKDRPGALCAITDFIARNHFSIVSGLVRKTSHDKNILEATLYHESTDCSREDLIANPQSWAKRLLKIHDLVTRTRLKYYGVSLAPPVYPRVAPFEPVPLFEGLSEAPDSLVIVSAIEAEKDLAAMASKASNDLAFKEKRWLTDLLFAGDWNADGKPSVFLSYPLSGRSQGAFLKKAIEDLVHVRELQRADAKHITEGAIERIVHAHYFIGLWHPEGTSDGGFDLSPWMQFEYGVALSHNKDCLVVNHESLPRKLVDRIDRNRGRIQYRDLVSETDTVERIRERCSEWAAAHRTLSLLARP